jgi:hypothetical protein
LKPRNIPFIILCSLGIAVLAGSVIFRIRFLHAPLDRDEGEYAYAGWRLINGGVPYLDYYNMKMPGIYAAYALLFMFFGSTVEAVRWGLIIVNLINTFFVFRLGKKVKDLKTGVYAAICYLIFSLQTELQGTASHAEHFAMLFILPAVLFLWRAQEKKSMRDLMISGCLMGTGFLMKQPALSFILMAGLMLFIDALKNKAGWKYFFKSLCIFSGFALLPVVITAFLLSMAGAGHNFRLFAFDYAREYISYLSLNDGWHNCIATLSAAVRPNFLYWLTVPFAFLYMAFVTRGNKWYDLVLLFIFSFIAVSAGFYFRPHYFQFLLPAIALLAAFTLRFWDEHVRRKWLLNDSSNNAIAYLFLAALFFVFSERNLFTIKKEDEFIRKVYGLDFFNATRIAGEFIAANSKRDSKVAIFGAEPEIWFYSKRLAASGYLYVYPLLENQRFAPSMRKQFYEEIKNSRPDILVYTSNEGTWYAGESAAKEIYNWYRQYRDSSFKRIALIDMPWSGPSQYYFNEDTSVHPVNEENYIEIYRRK